MSATLSGTGVQNDASRVRSVRISLDNSYPANGYPLDFSPFGIRDAEIVLAEHTGGYEFLWNRATQKLLVYWYNYPGAAAAVAVEVTAATDLSAVVNVGLVVVGEP